MEVEFFSDEKSPVERDGGGGLWKFGDGVGGEVERLPGGESEELMDIDEVLVEVRQQVIGSGDQNAGSFLTYTDQFTPMKTTRQVNINVFYLITFITFSMQNCMSKNFVSIVTISRRFLLGY